MMREIVCLLLGGILGGACTYWKKTLIRNFEELKEENIKNIWVLPLVTMLLAIWAGRMSVSYVVLFFNIILISLLVLLADFDLHYMLLPTKVIIPGAVAALLAKVIEAFESGEYFFLVNGIVGGIVGFGLFWLIFYGCRLVLKKEGLGFGDVRLMAMIGIMMGMDQLFLMLIIACILAVIGGGIYWLIRRKSEAFPFGPYLCTAAIIMLLYGNELLTLYLNLLHL